MLACYNDVISLSTNRNLITPPARRAWRSYKFAALCLFFFGCRKLGYRSWVIPLYSIPIAIWAYVNTTFKLNFSGICRQNTQFNMYSTTSKQQEGCMFKDSHPKSFITTNFDKFPRKAVAKGDQSRWCFDSMFPWYTKSKVNSNGVCNYYNFIRRDGLSLAMWQLFDIVQSAFGENINMIVKIFCVCSSVDVCGTKARMHTYKYSVDVSTSATANNTTR